MRTLAQKQERAAKAWLLEDLVSGVLPLLLGPSLWVSPVILERSVIGGVGGTEKPLHLPSVIAGLLILVGRVMMSMIGFHWLAGVMQGFGDEMAPQVRLGGKPNRTVYEGIERVGYYEAPKASCRSSSCPEDDHLE
jgi:hypothetical protein